MFGYNQQEVEAWGGSLAKGLDVCDEWAVEKRGKPKNPHCWIYIPTVNIFETPEIKLGPLASIPRVAIGEVPNFRVDPEVAYCIKGATYCYVT